MMRRGTRGELAGCWGGGVCTCKTMQDGGGSHSLTFAQTPFPISSNTPQPIPLVCPVLALFPRLAAPRQTQPRAGDMGRLESERGPLSANVTFVSHWGLASSKKAERLNSSPWRASHRNATDIVLPVYISLRKLEKYGITRSRHHPKFATMAPPEIRERNGPLFWFAG